MGKWFVYARDFSLYGPVLIMQASMSINLCDFKSFNHGHSGNATLKMHLRFSIHSKWNNVHSSKRMKRIKQQTTKVRHWKWENKGNGGQKWKRTRESRFCRHLKIRYASQETDTQSFQVPWMHARRLFGKHNVCVRVYAIVEKHLQDENVPLFEILVFLVKTGRLGNQ